MADADVDVLEVVQVDQQQADLGLLAVGDVDRLTQRLVERISVGQARKRVEVRKPPHLPVGAAPLDGIAHRPFQGARRQVLLDQIVGDAGVLGLDIDLPVALAGEQDERPVAAA